jgi:hypothetical protein
MGLALAWFGLAYRRRQFSVWELGLVLLGGAAALARVGNAWADGICLWLPLARQASQIRIRPMTGLALAALSLAATVAVLAITRPPALPNAALQAVLSGEAFSANGAVFADPRWAPELQHQLGPNRQVLAARGLAAESTDFWLDYLRVTQGHERWAELLHEWNVDTVVLDAADQQRQVAGLIRSSSDWQLLYDSGGTLVAQRVAGR